jgi:hypothetical protein
MSTRTQGEWQSEGGKQTFRSLEGGILNWWPNGTIQFQGKADEKSNLERLVQKALTAKQSNMEPDKVNPKGSGPVIPPRSESYTLEVCCCESAALLKRVKYSLSDLGLTIMLINDSSEVVREIEYDHYCSLVERGSEVHIREL